MTSSNEIKPCPFCGEDSEDLLQPDSGHFVFCESCEAQGPWAADEAQAIENWNRRVE